MLCRLRQTLSLSRRYSTSPLSRCPSCATPLPTALPTCSKCKYIAPLPTSMTFFHYFNLPTTESSNLFRIDTRELRRRFLQTQRLCHPDAWAQEGVKELALAAAQSSQLNKAYQTLLSPLDRAHYILSLHGVKESETERLEDDELIIQVMEARQEVDEASSIEELNKVKKINRERIDRTVKKIEGLIGEKDWQGARQATVRLKYWLGIENAAKESAYS